MNWKCQKFAGQVAALARSYMNGVIPFKETIEQNNNSCYPMTLSGINYNCKLRRAATLPESYYPGSANKTVVPHVNCGCNNIFKNLKHWRE